MSATIISNESIDAYHANPALSNSKVSVFLDGGPELYRQRFVAKTLPHPEPTDAMMLGQQIDTLVTESRELFAQRYLIKPQGMSFATTAGKNWKAEHGLAGKPIIAWDDWLMMEQVEKAIQEHPLFPVLVHPKIRSQVTVRAEISSFGFGLQSRPDWLSMTPCEISDGLPYSINLKTTADWTDWFDESDPTSQKAGSPVYNYGYHRQAALDQWVLAQTDLGETRHFLLVAEKQAPYRVGVVQLTEEYLEAGFYEINADLERLKACYASNTWPKQPTGVVKLGPPKWLTDRAMRKAIA